MGTRYGKGVGTSRRVHLPTVWRYRAPSARDTLLSGALSQLWHPYGEEGVILKEV